MIKLEETFPSLLDVEWVRRSLAVLAFSLFGVLFLASLFNFSSGPTPDYLWVFDADEFLGFDIAWKGLERNNPFFTDGVFEHGTLHQALSFGVVKLMNLFGYAQNSYLVILSLRVISLLSAVACVVLLYRISRFFIEKKVISLLLSLCLVANPDFLYLATCIHPDVLMLSLVLASCFSLLYFQTKKGLLFAGLSIGAACSAKISPLVTAPFLVLPFFLKAWNPSDTLRTYFRGQRQSLRIFFYSSAGSFLLLSPHVLLDPLLFLAKMVHLSQIFRDNWCGQISQSNPFLWFEVASANLGSGVLTILLLGLFLTLIVLFRDWRRKGLLRFMEKNENRFLLTFVLILILEGIHLIPYRLREFRYLYPVFPFFILVGFYGINRLSHSSRPVYRVSGLLMTGILIVGLCLNTYASIEATNGAGRKDEAPQVTYWDWFREQYPPTTPIAFDQYLYKEGKTYESSGR
jgi:hypothetical protein